MYRENKYGEKIDVQKYTCASCKHYCFEREDDTNKCRKYGQYYWMSDSCSNHWEESDDCSGGGFWW